MTTRCRSYKCMKPSAFSSTTRCGELWYISPPTRFITALATGGLKKLYDDIRENKYSNSGLTLTDDDDVSYCYTDDDGHFNPVNGMPLLAHRYRFVEILARGHTSVVLRVKDTLRENQIKIIKVLHVHYYLIGGQEADILTDINAADVRETFPIIRLRNLFRLGQHYCLVFDSFNHLPLHFHFTQRLWIRDKSLKGIMLVASRLLAALHFLHQQNVIHADLKPENLLMVDDEPVGLDIRLTDFGNSIRNTSEEICLYEEDFELQTLIYRAPEVFLGVGIGIGIDVWSVGCILAELYQGKPLFKGQTKDEILSSMVDILGPLPREFLDGKFGPKYHRFLGTTVSRQETINRLQNVLQCTNPEFLHLLAGLLRYKTDDRLSAFDAIQCPFLGHFYPLSYLMHSHANNPGLSPPKGDTEEIKNNPTVTTSRKLLGLKRPCFQVSEGPSTIKQTKQQRKSKYQD